MGKHASSQSRFVHYALSTRIHVLPNHHVRVLFHVRYVVYSSFSACYTFVCIAVNSPVAENFEKAYFIVCCYMIPPAKTI